MAFIAAAVIGTIGSSLVGGVTSVVAGNRQADAALEGAQTAADATVQSTQLQIDEIRRQYDYQQQILLPQIQTQYNAQGAVSDLLRFGGLDPSVNRGTPGSAGSAGSASSDNRLIAPGERIPAGQGGTGFGQDNPELGLPQYLSQGQSNVNRLPRGNNGQFLDPNLDRTRLADINTFGDNVRNNRLAGETAGQDEFVNYVADNSLAAPTAAQDVQVQRANDVTLTGARGGDLLANGAAAESVYGESFTESPGYAFQLEEIQRESDRIGSAGGNYGGRAVIEAQRRAAGLAADEYYNYAAGRNAEINRLATAEAQDAARLDSFAGADIGRGDQALQSFEQQRLSDVGRGDLAFENYLGRSTIDAGRLDAAAQQEDSFLASDRQRDDQAYYNYLANLQGIAGFGGGSAAQAVNASQAAGAQTAGAFSQQGSSLSNIYSQLGTDQANIIGGTAANVNNSLIAGATNLATIGAGV